MGADRFKFEEQLLQLSVVEDDIGTLIDSLENELDVDTIANVLIGIQSLFSLRFSRMFCTFEELVRNGEIKSPPAKAATEDFE